MSPVWVIVIVLAGGHQQVVDGDYPNKPTCTLNLPGLNSAPPLKGKTLRCVKRRNGMQDYPEYSMGD